MITKKLLLAAVLLCFLQKAMATDLPIDTLGSKDMSKPLVLYISGDGGFNSFSTTFVQQWNRNGYPVVALNALISQYLSLWKRNEVILIGYSFGSDVMPFIQNRLNADIASKIKHTILFSPSKSTDFTIHLFYNDNGSNVPAEINKLNKPVLIVFGDQESNLPDKQINNKLVTIIKVAGDHHYNNQVGNLVNDVATKL